MKKADVKVGGTYAAKVSGKVVPVRIDAQNPRGGWDATNTATGKKVRIKSAQRLRGAVHKSKPMALAIPSQAGAAKEKPTPKAESKNAAAKGKKRTSALDAAVKVLGEAKKPMTCKEMVEQMLAKGLWQTKGKTPAATLYSAILREIQKKGKDARFRKVERGKFTVVLARHGG